MGIPIELFVEERGIASLYHFTRLDNLTSILENGLLTKEACARAGINPVINDLYRYDGTGAVSTTIGYPNYKLLYRLRCENPDVEWVILELGSWLLWRTNCLFSDTNAGACSVYSAPVESRQGLGALRSMFGDYGPVRREDLVIPRHYTTNPQAEVLLLEGATAKDIVCVYFERDATHREFRTQYPALPSCLNGGLFSPRKDYEHWM